MAAQTFVIIHQWQTKNLTTDEMESYEREIDQLFSNRTRAEQYAAYLDKQYPAPAQRHIVREVA